MSKGRVLLVNPWIVDFAAYDFWIKPIGLLSIAAVLRENGYDIDFLDCMDRNHPSLIASAEFPQTTRRPDGTGHFYKEHIPKPKIISHIPRHYSRYGLPLTLVKKIISEINTPDVILLTSGMTYWYPGVFEMIGILRDISPGVTVVLGGIYATLCYDHATTYSGADRVMAGPGEIQALKVVDEITGNRSNTDQYTSLDDLPVPWYGGYSHLDSAAILTSRGCPYRCPFCASHLLNMDYEKRSPQRVVDEIDRLHNDRGVNEFAFYDDALLHNKAEHLFPILKAVMNRKLTVHFHTPNGIPPRAIDANTARIMKQAGFQTTNK